MQRSLLLFFTSLLLLTACTKPELTAPNAETEARGDVVQIEYLEGYSGITAKLIVWSAGMLDRVPVSYGVDLFRVTYRTLDEQGELTTATGLLSLPRTDKAIGLTSWQHGTTVTRNQVPSTPTPDEGLLASLVFAGHGYVLVAPDYVGLGGSKLNHPYYHADTAAANIRDLIIAANQVLETSKIARPNQLFLAGFSQGGYNTMVAARDIEQNPIANLTLTASASVAGPTDLEGFSFPNALKGESPSASMYLSYLLFTYSRVYKKPMSEIFRSPYAETIPQVFDGNSDSQVVSNALPKNPRDLFPESSLAQFDQGNLGWIGERLAENSIKDWQPITPVRLYYGGKDIDVSPLEATNQITRWRALGIEVEAINVGEFDHNESVIEAAPMLRDWFDSIRKL